MLSRAVHRDFLAMNIRNRIFKVEPNADSDTVRLMLLCQDYEFDPRGRKDRRGMCLDYRIVARWMTIMSSTTREFAEREARASWRMYPVSTKPHRAYTLPSSVRCIMSSDEVERLRKQFDPRRS